MLRPSVRALPFVLGALALSACSGGSLPADGTPRASTEAVTGTLAIVSTNGSSAQSSRRAQFVSPATGAARLYIDGATTPAGTATSCSPSTACTIDFSANLVVPSTHTLAVEIDTGASGTPANTVLAVGSGQYQLVGGSNTLSPLSLNGVAATYAEALTSCPNATACDGTITIADASGNAITYGGSTPVPTGGVNPTSGNVFDNFPSGLAFAVSGSSTSGPFAGLLTGTAQPPFSTFASGTLTVAGVDTTGSYAFAVGCAATGTSKFTLSATAGGTPSRAVSAAELAAASPALAYPSLSFTGTAPVFVCTNGSLTTLTGTLPVN